MASNTRSGRRPPQNQISISALSTLERLLLAQAVYEFGAGAWPSVAKLLSRHPLMSLRPKTFFTAQSCSTLYTQMLAEAELTSVEDVNAPRSQTSLKLAEKYYQARVLELRDLILAEENKFKTLVQEIDEIRAGHWDDKIRAKIMGQSPPSDVTDLAKHPGPKSPAQAGAIDHEMIQSAIVTTTELDTTASVERTGDISRSKPKPIPAIPDPHTDQLPDISQPLHEVLDPLRSLKDSARVLVEGTEDEPMDTVDEREDNPEPHPLDMPTSQAPDTQHEPEKELAEKAATLASLLLTPEKLSPPDASLSTRRRDNKRKTSSVELAETHRDGKRVRDVSDLQEEEELGPSTTRRRTLRHQPQQQSSIEDKTALKRFQNVISMLFSQISSHRNGNIFHNPIKDSEAPDYHEIVKRPMDLKTIKAKIKDGTISNSLGFQRDVYLMFANAMMYNRPNSDIYTMTEEMMLESEQLINAFRQTEGFAQRTLRS